MIILFPTKLSCKSIMNPHIFSFSSKYSVTERNLIVSFGVIFSYSNLSAVFISTTSPCAK